MLKCYIKNEVPDEKTVRVKKVGETVMKNPKIGEMNKCNQSQKDPKNKNKNKFRKKHLKKQ